MDREYLLYIINDIKQEKGKPSSMTDKKSAYEFLPILKIEFPNIQMIEVDETIWFVASPRAKIALKKSLRKMINVREQEIRELHTVIDKLDEG